MAASSMRKRGLSQTDVCERRRNPGNVCVAGFGGEWVDVLLSFPR